MMGHRRRIKLALAGWAFEMLCTSLGVVKNCYYSQRATKRVRRVTAGRVRAWQKRQDRREVDECDD